uniref:Putative ATP-dependent Clp protease n=1 Tax=Paulinella micropora TaxID=1928728 RepID=A0A385I070_9EUKA|nr:putative ATP-dependent Clp protease [Paulinella micropora]AXY63301.1 putative ATP-dependent Clp protease [Paulinella micropora]
MFPYESRVERSLINSPNHFSEAGWNLILAAQNEARNWNHIYLDVEHILYVLFNNPNFYYWIKDFPANVSTILDKIEAFCSEQPFDDTEELFIGIALEELIDTADHYRRRWGSRFIDIPHILRVLFTETRIAKALLIDVGLSEKQLLRYLRKAMSPLRQTQNVSHLNIKRQDTSLIVNNQIPVKPRVNVSNSNPMWSDSTSQIPQKVAKQVQDTANDKKELNLEVITESTFSALENFGRDLTAAARDGLLDPVIGRDNEIRRLIQVLSRRGKNNPVLIGAPGVGKTATVELLAQRIVAGKVPTPLKGLRLIALDIGTLVAGTKFRGQFEERLRNLLNEINNPEKRVVLFIDELHSFVNSDRSTADASSLLKPALARGELRCIGATTPEHYRRTVARDVALNRRFQQIIIKEPSEELSIEIVRGLKGRYELHHGITITDRAIVAANRLAARYISDRCLPDKAIDLIDEAAAELKMNITSQPHLIEEVETELARLKAELIATEGILGIDQRQLQHQQQSTSARLMALYEQWEREKERLSNLQYLQEEDEALRSAIHRSREEGNLEEAKYLQVNQLSKIQNSRVDLEQSFNETLLNGNILLREQVEESDIARIVARWTGIPVQRVLSDERQKLLDLEERLRERVIGQPEAVFAVAAAIRRARAGMKNPYRPVGSFLFLGPTGVGKTELAKALAAALFDEDEALIRLDMSEFMERNAVARLLGAPPGYIGYEEGGQLTEAVRQHPYAVLLLDEVEKAHPDVFNLLLQVLDDGRLTDSQGRTVDFQHTVIVMTSNLAGKAILNRAKQEKSKTADDNCELAIEAALNKQFRPEFLNRIDEVIRFHPLTLVDLQHIVRLQLASLAELLMEEGLRLEIEESVVYQLARQGYEPEYGARPLRRIIRRKIENPLATQLLEDHFRDAIGIKVLPSGNNSQVLSFRPQHG